MADSSDLWYRLGYALENARHGHPARGKRAVTSPPAKTKRGARKLTPLREREPGARVRGRAGAGTDAAIGDASGDVAHDVWDLVLAAGAGSIVGRVLSLWPTTHRPGLLGLARGAAAGALAALLRQAIAPLLSGELRAPDLVDDLADDLPERLAAGAARGLVYGGVIEPRVPASPLVQGLLYGTAEWGLGEWGGVRGLLARHTPYRRLPVVNRFLGDAEAGERTLIDHVAFGLALALLYDAGRRMGMGDDAE
jgi:hypothetical protein